MTPQELHALVMKETAEGRTVEIEINSGSMRPFLKEGDMVRLSAPTDIRRGDVVLARCEEGKVVLHAVTRVSAGRLTLRGTANLHGREECREKDVAAKVADLSRRGIQLWPDSALLRRILLRILH